MSEEKEQALTEGWQGEKTREQRFYHYIVGTASLCQRLGFYKGELQPAVVGKPRWDFDCLICYRRLQKRLGQTGKKPGN